MSDEDDVNDVALVDIETNDSMTTVSKTFPISPCSGCSGPSSSRSDWFRQSVLFWSSQSERSEEECTNDRRCKCHSSESFASSQMSLLSNISPCSDHSAKALSPRGASPRIRTHKVKSPRPKYPSFPEGGEQKEEAEVEEEVQREPKMIEYDPSDLLKQVEELERCFSSSSNDLSLDENVTNSPHLTLKFPKGSSINKSPLYSKKHPDIHTNQNEDNDKKNDIDDKVLADDDTEDQNIIETIQNVQNTLREISREIEQSSETEQSRKHSLEDVKVVEDNEMKTTNTQLKNENKIDSQKSTTNGGHERDPNKVMMSLLSNIKPPPPTPEVKEGGVTNKRKTSDHKRNNSLKDNVVNTEELLLKIDQLIQCNNPVPPNGEIIKHEDEQRVQKYRDRLDSGLQSTSSDSNSPAHSPRATRAFTPTATVNGKPQRRSSYTSGFYNNNKNPYVIQEVSQEKSDSVFPEDSDFSSDCSPMSTLASNSHFRPRSLSASYSVNNRPRVSAPLRISSGNITDTDAARTKKLNTKTTSELERLHEKHEAETVRKFLALTKQYNDSKSNLDSICLDDIAFIPTIRDAIDEHRKELADQRKKQEEFLHQLGDLLLEVVNLKEEHTTVRTKQTKALNILKKQLDVHKKTQTQAHNDVINKVNSLDEKLNLTINHSSRDQLSSSPSFTKGLTSFGPPDPSNTLQRGHIIWKVADVMKKLTRVKSGNVDGTIVSPTFLTSEYGYKMNAWLYVNGRGKTVGKYLSLYVCVLVGDYDAILHWPILPTYTLTLMDQQSDSAHRQDYVKVRRVLDIAGRGRSVIAQSRGIPRPSDGTKALIVGFDDFISHEELLNRRYLVDDTLFLKIQAEVGTA